MPTNAVESRRMQDDDDDEEDFTHEMGLLIACTGKTIDDLKGMSETEREVCGTRECIRMRANACQCT